MSHHLHLGRRLGTVYCESPVIYTWVGTVYAESLIIPGSGLSMVSLVIYTWVGVGTPTVSRPGRPVMPDRLTALTGNRCLVSRTAYVVSHLCATSV